jgi:hypothetical protein
MDKLTFYITTEQLEALRALSERTRVPMSVYQRESVDAVLEVYKGLLTCIPAVQET